MRLFHFSSALLLGHVVAAYQVNEASFAQENIIERDVAITGGGASGTYAAVRLREDYNISIVVVEKEDHLGGHVNTYTDPNSGVPIDYGVLAYLRYGHSASFFSRFNIPIKPYASAPQESVYISTSNSSILPSYSPPSFPEQIAAFQKWLLTTEKYAHLMLPGLWNFPAGKDIPDELLMPFGQFAREKGIEAVAPLFTSIGNVGVGGIDQTLLLYVLFAMGEPVTKEFLNGSLFQPDGYSNSELYQRAYNLLQDDVMLNSMVSHAERNDEGVKLVIQRAGCANQLIKAKKLLFTPPPSIARLTPFGLDAYEERVLSTWTPTWTWAAVAQVSGLPSNTSYYWYAPEVGSEDYLEIRDNPWSLSLTSAPGVPDSEHLFEVLLSANYSISADEAKNTISTEIAKFCTSQKVENCTTDFRALVNHNSVLWRQSPEQLRDNIVREIYALQGQKSTWFTGGLWSADYTGNVWAFTESLLPRLLASLKEA